MKKNSLKLMSFMYSLPFLVLPAKAFAGGSNMPWEAPLQKILDSISGPVARAMAVMAIVVTGLGLAFGEGGSGFRKLLWVVFGISIAFAATSFFMSFFKFAGGAVF